MRRRGRRTEASERRARIGRHLMVGCVVIGMLAAGIYGLVELWRAATTGCVAARYGHDCWIDEPAMFVVGCVIRSIACVCAFAVSGFVTWLLWLQDHDDRRRS